MFIVLLCHAGNIQIQILQIIVSNYFEIFVIYTRVSLFEYHLKFWNTGSIEIPVKSLLQSSQTCVGSYWSMVLK